MPFCEKDFLETRTAGILGNNRSHVWLLKLALLMCGLCLFFIQLHMLHGAK